MKIDQEIFVMKISLWSYNILSFLRDLDLKAYYMNFQLALKFLYFIMLFRQQISFVFLFYYFSGVMII